MDTRILKFKVKKQQLTRDRSCDFSNIVAGSVGYLRARFYLSSEWDGCKKVASFWAEENGEEYAVFLDENNSCLIPTEALTNGYFYVRVTGAKAGYKLMTNKIGVKQEVH